MTKIFTTKLKIEFRIQCPYRIPQLELIVQSVYKQYKKYSVMKIFEKFENM